MKRKGLELFDFTRRTADLELLGKDRASGLHLSDIVKEMKIQAGEKVDGIEGEQDWYRAQLGFLFERAIENEWKTYWGMDFPDMTTQLQLEQDEIHMTPDGFDFDNHRLMEFKLTWKSARKWEEDLEKYYWPWLVQTKGYMWALSHALDEPVLDVLFIIGFVNGDYKGKWRLGVWTDLLSFDLIELKENWETVLRYKEFMQGGGE
jgi:hypothetical protein